MAKLNMLSIIISLTCFLSPCLSCPVDQKQALLDFKSRYQKVCNSSSLNSNLFSTFLNSWNSSPDCCSWQRVTCDSSSSRTIQKLDLSSTDSSCSEVLDTKIFTPIFGIQTLLWLNVSWSRIRDEIPYAALTNLTRLVHLNMSNNNFYGSIPREMFQLKHLESLDLCYNYYLTGTIPQDIGNLKNLRYLSLAGNQITGGIPHGLSNLKGLKLLERLELQNNKLVGEIPVSLFNSSAALKALHLGGNQLTWNNKAVIKHSYMLEELSLRSCGLAGEIPEWISRQTSLTFLDLSVNSLHGILPISLAKINFNYLNLSNNMLNGSLPHIFQSNLTVPLEIYALLDLSSNQLTGEVPSSLGNLKGLKLLNLSNNHLSGTIPTSFGNLENVESLDLAHNELHGSIPESLTKLQQLKVLDVSNNRLTGKIPVGGKLGTMTNPDYYANNSGLCGMQIRKPCPEDASPQQQPKEQELSEELMSFFLPAAGIGYAVGLMVSVGVIYFPGS